MPVQIALARAVCASSPVPGTALNILNKAIKKAGLRGLLFCFVVYSLLSQGNIDGVHAFLASFCIIHYYIIFADVFG